MLNFSYPKLMKRKNLNAFNFVFEKDALNNSEKIEEKIKTGESRKTCRNGNSN